MDTLYISPSRAAAKRRAQHFAEVVADGLLSEAKTAMDEAVRLVQTLRGCGAGSISIGAVKDAIYDALGDAQGAINRELDKEGLATDRHQLDRSELEAS